MSFAPALLLVAVLLAAPAGAASFDRGDLRVELAGSAKTLYTATRSLHLHEIERFGKTPSDTGSLLGRLRLEGEFGYGERWAGELVYDVEGRTGSGLDPAAFAIAEEIGTRTWLDLDRTVSDHDDLHARHLLYRGWLRYHDERLELTLGRQRIPLGRGRLWNPTDLFNPIGPLEIEGDQRIGQDAALARVRLGEGIWGVGIWSPQDDPDDHRAAVRLEMVRRQLDAAVMSGRFGRDWMFGGDFARNLGGAAIRGEATYTRLKHADGIWQVVLSIDYTASVGSGLYLLAEHFYNENLIDSSEGDLSTLVSAFGMRPQLTPAETKRLLRGLAEVQAPFLDRFTTVARHQTGFQAGYDLTPLIRANLLTIFDWDEGSIAVFPILFWAARDDLEVSGGLQLFYGSADSQYGRIPPVFFMQIELFF